MLGNPRAQAIPYLKGSSRVWNEPSKLFSATSAEVRTGNQPDNWEIMSRKAVEYYLVELSTGPHPAVLNHCTTVCPREDAARENLRVEGHDPREKDPLTRNERVALTLPLCCAPRSGICIRNLPRRRTTYRAQARLSKKNRSAFVHGSTKFASALFGNVGSLAAKDDPLRRAMCLPLNEFIEDPQL
jgi:hypothetical protein